MEQQIVKDEAPYWSVQLSNPHQQYHSNELYRLHDQIRTLRWEMNTRDNRIRQLQNGLRTIKGDLVTVLEENRNVISSLNEYRGRARLATQELYRLRIDLAIAREEVDNAEQQARKAAADRDEALSALSQQDYVLSAMSLEELRRERHRAHAYWARVCSAVDKRTDELIESENRLETPSTAVESLPPCPICMEPVTNCRHVLVPCGHTICKPCLDTLRSMGSLQCPQCRSEVQWDVRLTGLTGLTMEDGKTVGQEDGKT
jgi:hypothetical protein